MDEKTKNIIKNAFDTLPEGVQELLMSSEFQDSLVEISQKYQLTIEQASALDLETTLVMMGINPLKSFEDEIQKALGIDAVKSLEIVTDINEKIFISIHPLLQLMNTPEGADPVVDEEIMPTTTESVQTEVIPTQIHTAPAQTDTQVLSSAGIEITSTIPETPKPQMPITEKREEILAKVEKPDDVIKSMPTYTPPAMPVIPTPAQTAPVPIVTTTQQSMAPVYTPPTHTNPAPISSPAPVSKADPYRMPIE